MSACWKTPSSAPSPCPPKRNSASNFPTPASNGVCRRHGQSGAPGVVLAHRRHRPGALHRRHREEPAAVGPAPLQRHPDPRRRTAQTQLPQLPPHDEKVRSLVAERCMPERHLLARTRLRSSVANMRSLLWLSHVYTERMWYICVFSGTRLAAIAWRRGAVPTSGGVWRPTPASRWRRSDSRRCARSSGMSIARCWRFLLWTANMDNYARVKPRNPSTQDWG